MNKSAVIELQELASNGDHDIGDLLRKTLMVATKLGLTEFRQWALAELNGYKGDFRKNLPDYRIVRGELKVYNPMHGLIPFQVPHQLHEVVTKIDVTESLHSLLQLLSNERSGHIIYNFGPAEEEILMSLQDDFVQLRPTRTVGKNQIMNILGAVRTTILDWSLTLEADGILGEDLLFSEKEKQAAMHNINIQNFQGVLGNIDGGSSVTQTNSQQITAADFSALARYLTESGVSKVDLEDLHAAVRDDPKPSSVAEFGPKVSLWIGKMMGKAAAGSWQISIATAGGFLANALGKFYGLT